ncbi:MAG: hypothetical protein DMG57_41755 [Acidobacteria bacterium]|nr:MAG: hypothetical protein DMG57_41755 [Acidobacteriota bacterium]
MEATGLKKGGIYRHFGGELFDPRRFHEFDPQPFHLDEAAAEASVFKGLAASGWHIAAAAMRLLVTQKAEVNIRYIMIMQEQ